MRTSLLLGAILALHTYAGADCDAHGLSFRHHSGTLHGFTVTKLFDEGEAKATPAARRAVVPFGDYHFSIAHGSGEKLPQPVRIDHPAIANFLGGHLVAGEFYRDDPVQRFSVLATAAFDLDGDLEADLVLFDVSPGTNVYSGAVGRVGPQWFTVVEPTCS